MADGGVRPIEARRIAAYLCPYRTVMRRLQVRSRADSN